MFNKSIVAFSSFVMLTLSGTALAQTAPAESGTENINIAVTELKFFDTGINGVTDVGPILGAPAFGDLSKGEHSTWIVLPAKFKSVMHTHTYDLWVAVVSGVSVNTGAGGKDISLSAGSYWFQPAGKPHYTNCISSVECVLFANQNGAFDSIPVKK